MSCYTRTTVCKGMFIPTVLRLNMYMHLNAQFTEDEFIPRTCESYDYHCSLLEGPTYNEDSVTYGIRFDSPLNDLKGFHVVNNMPHDIMHVLFEGVLPYEVTLLIRQLIVQEKLFSLEELNNCVQSFLFSTLEAKDIPSPLKSQALTTSNVSQSCRFII